MAPPVAIMALDGMQSHRLAAPPTMSRSMSVTSTPEAGGVHGRLVAGGASADDHEAHGHRLEGAGRGLPFGRGAMAADQAARQLLIR